MKQTRPTEKNHTPMKYVIVYFPNGEYKVFSPVEEVEVFARDSCGYVLSFQQGDVRYMFTTLSCAGWSVS